MEADAKQYFAKSPGTLPLYAAAEAFLLELPRVSKKVHETQVSFYAGKAFAWIWLPIRKMKNRPGVYIVLSFGLDHQIISPRIIEAVQPYPNRWTHHLIIQHTADFDEEVQGLLRQAHQFAQTRGGMINGETH